MQLRLTPITTGLCLLGLVTVPAFAAPASMDNTSEQQLIEKLSKQTAALQQEVTSLQAQVKSLKAAHVAERPAAAADQHTQHPKKAKVIAKPVAVAKSQTAKPAVEPTTVQSLEEPPPYSLRTIDEKPLYIGGTPIVSSAYLGERSAFNAYDLIALIPSVGVDIRLLKEHDNIYNMYKQYNLPVPTDPIITVSGALEAQYLNQRPYTGNKKSDVDLTRGEFDVAANINQWTTAFLAFAYDNAPPSSGTRVANSRVFLDKGFLTIGNLNKSPFYGTIGQYYVRFGHYTSNMVSDPLTKMMARTKDRALQLGYDKTSGDGEINLAAYTFKGDSKTSANESKLNSLGFDGDYTITETNWNAMFGGSVISNMADSLGMQSNGAAGGFTGFGSTSEVLVRRVPAYDLHTSIGIGSYNILAEYVHAFHGFAPQNMTYNGHGADPSALNLEAAYNFHMFDKPTSLAVGYGMTRDALALLLPEQRYITTLNMAIWKDTIESLEYRHDINYPGSATATGQGLPVLGTGAGHSSDTVTFQIGVYF